MIDERMEWAEAKAIMEFVVKYMTALSANSIPERTFEDCPYTKEEIEAAWKRIQQG